MKPIDYYTTISENAARNIKSLSYMDKTRLMSLISSKVAPIDGFDEIELTDETIDELFNLNTNQELGLIKALADQCQETLISK